MGKDNIIKPYGDTLNDGVVQLSFTLPVKATAEAKQAAIELCKKMGFEKVLVAHMEPMGDEFSFFVVYGQSSHEIDMSSITVPQVEHPTLNFDQVNTLIKDKIGRKLVVVGACIGYDAHTVGIDAIFNMKGFNHDWGLERYPMLAASNLRAQVTADELVTKIVELKADAVLISRVITQKDEHITELKNFLTKLNEASDVPSHLVKICGGPRISHEEAVSWGYDAGFGPGTIPSQVASYIAYELIKKGVK